MFRHSGLLLVVTFSLIACSEQSTTDESGTTDSTQNYPDPGGTDGTDGTTGSDGADGTDGAAGTDESSVIEEPCPIGSRKCLKKNVALICNDTGTGYIQEKCVKGTSCSGGYCKLIKCEKNQPLGVCHNEKAAEVCDSTGTAIELDFCTTEKPICLNGECRDLQCSPKSKRCKGTGAIEQCKDDGSAWAVYELCGPGNICKNAQCNTACDVNIKENTYTGCEYWAVDLDNIEGGKYQQVAVVVSNPDSLETAAVTIHNLEQGADLLLPTNTVPPLGQEVFLLPKGFDLEGTMKSQKTFRIRASAPVTVHQFNPLNAENVYSNDASLLLPSNVAGKEFLIMSWPQRQADQLVLNPVRGFTSIIAVDQGQTTVKVVAPVNLEPGEGIEILPANVEGTFILKYGEVLNLESGGSLSGPDLTGTHILSDKRVSVFSGHECANVPLIIKEGVFKGTKFCDHIESQAFPVDTWGENYVADAFAPRSPGQKDIWRIMAGADGVTISTDPPQPGANGVKMNKGQFVEFESSEHFFVSATGPVSLGHYLKGSNYAGFEPVAKCSQGNNADTGIGDPAFTLTPPNSQLRSSYIVLTPANYSKNYLNISYQDGADILIDGNPVVLNDVSVGLTEWNLETVEVSAGVHRVETTTGLRFGVTAYGYDCDVSYAYPGGLNLDPEAEEID